MVMKLMMVAMDVLVHDGHRFWSLDRQSQAAPRITGRTIRVGYAKNNRACRRRTGDTGTDVPDIDTFIPGAVL